MIVLAAPVYIVYILRLVDFWNIQDLSKPLAPNKRDAHGMYVRWTVGTFS